jgi:hypothetical protein
MAHEIQGGILPFALLYAGYKSIGLRKKFSNDDEKFLKMYGNYSIGKMTVARKPINSFLGKALSLITLNEWEKAVKKYGYDKLFHLSLYLDLTHQNTGKTITAVFEKNETPRIYQMVNPITNDTETMPVPTPYSGNLNIFLKTTQTQMGDNFWRYDAFYNNCQNQILNALGANNLLTRSLQNFIKQDVEKIAEDLPTFSTKIISGVTTLARKARTLVGKGLEIE